MNAFALNARDSALQNIRLVAPAVLAGHRCDESRERPGRCNAPAVAVVKVGQQTVMLCLGCAWNRIKYHGGQTVVTTDPALLVS